MITTREPQGLTSAEQVAYLFDVRAGSRPAQASPGCGLCWSTWRTRRPNPNRYDWLATTPTPGQKNPRKVTPWWEEDFAEMADRKITAALQGTVTGKHEPEPELRDTPYPGQDEKRIAERPRRPSPRTEVVLDGDASARLNTRGMT